MINSFSYGYGPPYGEGAAPPASPPAPPSFGDVVAVAKGSLLVGTGFLKVDDVFVAFLKDVEFYSSASLYEHILGAQGGRVEARIPTVVEAGLKVGYADIIANFNLFLLNTDSFANGMLTDHTAVFTILKTGNTITFPRCNIIPNGTMHLTEAGMAGANLEIKSSRQTLPIFS